MSKINYEQEIRDIVDFYAKHKRELPIFGDVYQDGEREMEYSTSWKTYAVAGWKDSHASLPLTATLDLLTINLIRWAREVKVYIDPFIHAFGIKANFEDKSISSLSWNEDNPTSLHCALMTAIDEIAN